MSAHLEDNWQIGDGSFAEWLWHIGMVFALPVGWIILLILGKEKK